MSGLFGRAADWLEFGRGGEGEDLCVHHGPACAMGTEPLAEIYVMVLEAKRRAGEKVPPLDEHRPMTAAERAEYRDGYEEALAKAKARNAEIEAQIRGEVP
ncbi:MULTISPECIES: hypothetical protein [unclassified Streptomyces]|uniref:hypothetical protein n=1 Tax=unclassified Streptomyces TaxID=2593676 RepID=UPI0029A35029|nr:hypothetical protein [Streptomyces sp. FL07-04A]MDX3578663.1 hypothetical protein [Streptomyces sp. FL07-04A]